MRRARLMKWLRTCLAAFLVFTQTLALLHECSHLSQDLPHAASAQAEPGACALCVAYAPLLGSLGAGPPPQFPVAVGMTPIRNAVYVFHPVLHFAFHAQAPPVSNATNA